MVKVLFVCMGNICRSPTAEAVFRRRVQDAGLADRVFVDSAGTHAYHVGEPPDRRALETAARRGFDMSGLRGRQVSANDIVEFDYVLAMDSDNLALLQQGAAASVRGKPRLLMDFAPHWGRPDVPDPYYGGARGFEQVLDMIEDAVGALLQEIQANGSKNADIDK